MAEGFLILDPEVDAWRSKALLLKAPNLRTLNAQPLPCGRSSLDRASRTLLSGRGDVKIQTITVEA